MPRRGLVRFQLNGGWVVGSCCIEDQEETVQAATTLINEAPSVLAHEGEGAVIAVAGHG
jgi:nucleoside phosphorylase